MSKRKKGVSLEEKRQRLLHIYTSSKEVYNLKEIEKLGAKAGVVLQTIKDVNQSLVDDSLVDCEKIGSGNFFWSFPSKLSAQGRSQVEALEKRLAVAEEALTRSKEAIEREKKSRGVSDERTQKLRELAEKEAKIAEMEKELKMFSENDPNALNKLEKGVHVAKAACNRWTDNLFSLKSWIVDKKQCPSGEVDKWLGIPDDFDYVE